MKARCYSERHHHYRYYGGRGIRVCRRWLSFWSFLSDMGKKPSKKHSLDRVDNNGNYEPGNCRWALPVTQTRNSRKVHALTIGGKVRSLAEWSEASGIATSTMRYRLRRGASPRAAVFDALSQAKRYGT